MLNLSTKEYDLNTLFSFDCLKEILIELAKSQIKLEKDMKNIQSENQKRDQRILKIQKILNNNNNNNYKQEIYYMNEQKEGEKEEEGEEERERGEEGKGEGEGEGGKEGGGKGKEEEAGQRQKKKNNIFEDNEANETNENNEEKQNNDKNLNIINHNKNILTKIKISENQKNNENCENTNNSSKEENENTKISPLLIRQIMKQIKEQKSKIDENKLKIEVLDEKLKKELKNKKEEEQKLQNICIDNEEGFKQINDKFNSLVLKNNDIEQKIESIQSNLKAFDIMTIFKDDGSGTIDATKVMVKALQEKVFKKFELVETRNKKESMDNLQTKNLVDYIITKIDKINRDIEKINELNNEQKEEFDDYKKNNEEINNEIKNNLIYDYNQKIDKLKEEIKLDINTKITSIENKIRNMNNEALDSAKNNNNIEKENLKIIDKKISDLRKKTNDIENTLKLHLKKNEIELVRNELKDIKSLLEEKLTKEDLKELYNYHLTNLDEINDIKDRLDLSKEEINKIKGDIRTAMQKLEIFQGNLILLQSSSGNPGFKKIIDFTKYVEQQKLNDTINPIAKKMEDILKEIESIRRDMIEIDDINKKYNKNAITKFEEENNKNINEFKIFIQKKYLEKYEFNRIIRNIEVQIKNLDDSKKKDADSWLLAKRNTKCFNCASCDANIKNENYTTADYLAWKKYPKGEKIHRMGQGFSHMLEMVSSEFAKNIEKNDFPNENNTNIDNNNNYMNTMPNQMERASSTKLKINKKDLGQDENIQNLKASKKIGKMKLPKMIQSKMKLKRNENLLNGNQVSDDENIVGEGMIIKNSNEKDEFQDESPKIVKIVKKNNKNDINSNSSDNFKNIQEEKVRVDKDNEF